MKIIKKGYLYLPRNREITLLVKQFSYLQGKQNPKVVSSCKVTDEFIGFPRNLKKLKKLLKREFEIIDKTISPSFSQPFALNPDFKLRDYQEKATKEIIQLLKKDTICVLNMQTGGGKSYMLPYIVDKMMTKTLILVDRVALVAQMEKEFKSNSQGDVNILNSKNKRVGDVNISTFQFLYQNPEFLKRLSKEIGFVVIDETHIVGAETYREVLGSLNHKYQLGMTATFSRSDGLTELLYDVMGSNIVKVDVPVLSTHLLSVDTGISVDWFEGQSFQEAFSVGMIADNVLHIVTKTIQNLLKRSRVILLYSTFDVIRQTYKQELAGFDIKSEIIDGKTSKKDREKYIDQLQKGEIDVLISGVILNKGISIHKLDTIINLSTHNKESLEQLVGRLRREHTDKKEPIFIDFAFKGVLRKQGGERLKLMENLARKYKDKLVRLELHKFMKML